MVFAKNYYMLILRLEPNSTPKANSTSKLAQKRWIIQVHICNFNPANVEHLTHVITSRIKHVEGEVYKILLDGS